MIQAGRRGLTEKQAGRRSVTKRQAEGRSVTERYRLEGGVLQKKTGWREECYR